MSDPGACGECLTSCCAICCVGGAASIENWCLFQAIGGRSRSTNTAGCCGSCCKKSFDNDDLADELDAARRERQEREQAANQSQPKAKEDMQAPSPRQSGEQPVSKNVENPSHETK